MKKDLAIRALEYGDCITQTT